MQSTTQRKLLLGFIASICLCGIIGIYCLAVGTMSSFEERIPGTTATVAALFFLALAAALPWNRRTWHPIGAISFVPLLPTLALTILAIWPQIYRPSGTPYYYWRMLEEMLGVSWTVVVALLLIGLLSLARLKRQWGLVKNLTAYAILATCGTIAVPILHRVSSIPLLQQIHTAELTLSISCPRCGKTEKLPVGRSQCKHCSLRIMIQTEEETCRTCGYPLYQIESAVCPECGTPIAREGAIEA